MPSARSRSAAKFRKLQVIRSPAPAAHARSHDLLAIERLTKSFGTRVAVDRISFGVRAGETLGLVGPNGAGKTTTVELIAGVLVPDAGRVTLGGLEPAAQRNRIGLAPQPIALYRELTVEENLRFFGRLYGLFGAALAARMEAVVDLVALGRRRKDRVGTLSGGMQRRLNLAVAILHEPELLLLDEPTAGVDPQSRGQIFESLEILKRAGTTLLYSTHYLEEAERLCDRVAVFDAGRIVAIDTVSELIARHADAADPVRIGAAGNLQDALLALTGRTPREA
jgi:ABC-2 type transport system ATP-binding protein